MRIRAFPPPFRIGGWWAQPDRNLLSRDGGSVCLEPRVMRTLVYLAGRPSVVVSRQELLDAVWPDVRVGEDSLSRAISDLRRALDDDPRTPGSIETIRGGGYRLLAPVARDPPASPGRKEASPRPAGRGWHLPLAVAGLVGICGLMLVLWRGQDRSSPAAVRRPVPLTSEPGLEVRPALSPDGTRVAFARRMGRDHTFDIFVGQRDVESALQLTSDPAYENYPAWSPDGAEVAFIRAASGTAGIFVVPALGGPARVLYRSEGDLRQLDWAADGRWLAFAESYRTDGSCRLMLLDVRGDEPALRVLTTPSGSLESGSYPRFSPAGDEVAFVRTGRTGLSDVYCVALTGDRLRRLTRGQLEIWGLDWNRAGDEIYFASLAGGPYTLSSVPLDGSIVRRASVLSEWVRHPSVARDAPLLVYESRSETQDILTVPARAT